MCKFKGQWVITCVLFLLQPHIAAAAASTPKPNKPVSPVQQVQATTSSHVIPADKLAPKGPPVSMAATLNDALCQSIHLKSVYFEEWKKRLAVIEERFLHPRKEAPLLHETIIVNTPGKSLVKIFHLLT